MAVAKTLIPMIIPLLFLIILANKVVSQDTTTFAFDSFTSNSKNLIYQGDAFVPTSSSVARLTKANSSGYPGDFSAGRVLYSPPVTFWDLGRQAAFETTLRFTITPVDNNPADGLTFFIIPVNSPIPNPSTGGSFGIFPLRTGVAPGVFAVEFDIFFGSDNAHWDPQYQHIGIDIESRRSSAVTRFENSVGQTVTARINYVSSIRTIIVFATYGSRNSTLTYTFDLKTILPRQVQVGVSAGTGGSVALHDLHSWYFTSTLVWDGVKDLNNNTYIQQYV